MQVPNACDNQCRRRASVQRVHQHAGRQEEPDQAGEGGPADVPTKEHVPLGIQPGLVVSGSSVFCVLYICSAMIYVYVK